MNNFLFFQAAKEYYAEAWVSKNEPFVLDVMFGKGSHVKVNKHAQPHYIKVSIKYYYKLPNISYVM